MILQQLDQVQENGKMSRPFWKEPLPSRLQVEEGSGHEGDDALMQITVQEMLKEKRRSESSYLQVGN